MRSRQATYVINAMFVRELFGEFSLKSEGSPVALLNLVDSLCALDYGSVIGAGNCLLMPPNFWLG